MFAVTFEFARFRRASDEASFLWRAKIELRFEKSRGMKHKGWIAKMCIVLRETKHLISSVKSIAFFHEQKSRLKL